MPTGPKKVELFHGPLDGAVIEAPPLACTCFRLGMQVVDHKVTGTCRWPEYKREYPHAIYQLNGNRWEFVKMRNRPGDP